VRGNEYGSVTGRPRRCGWFDAAALKRAVQLNGVSGLCITKLDVLDGLDTVRVAVGYKVNGETRDILPVGAEALAICEPVYEEHPGLERKHARREGLRKAARERAEIPSPPRSPRGSAGRAHLDRRRREETIVMKHPFE
jgi:adenylosuccinate synthase